MLRLRSLCRTKTRREGELETKNKKASAQAELDQGVLASHLGPRICVLWNLLSARNAAALAPFGLRSGAFSTLAMISANPGCSQNELARGLGMDKSAVVAIIDELEARDLASRERGTHDRRRHSLSLTAEGEAMMQRMFGPVTEVGLPIRKALTKQEIEQLLSLLDRAYDALIRAPATSPKPAEQEKV